MAILADLNLRLRMQTAELQKGIEAAKGKFSSFKNEAGKAFKDASSSISSSLNTLTLGISGMVQAGVKGFASLISGAKGFAAAFAATGIGALILGVTTALAGLIAYFKKTGEGEDKLAEATAYLKGIFEGMIKILVKVGEWIYKAFTDPKQAVIELWQVIKENLVNRFQGVVDLFVAGWNVIKNGAMGTALAIKGIFDEEAKTKSKEYFAEMAKGLTDVGKAALKISTGVSGEQFKGFIKGVTDSAKGMKALEQRDDAFQDKRRSWKLEEQDLEIALSRARLAASEQEDTSLEGKIKKVAFLNQAAEYQQRITEGSLKIAAEEISIEKERIRLTGDINDMTDDQKDKINQLEVAYKQLKVVGVDSIRGITKQASTLNEAITKATREADVPEMIVPIKGHIENSAFEEQKKFITESGQMWKEAEKNKRNWAKETADFIKNLDKEKLKRDMEYASQGLDFAMQGTEAFSMFQEAAMNKELAAAGDNEQKKDEIRRKYARRQKAISIAQTIIAGAQAIVQGFAQLGPIAGAIAAGLTAATTAAQIAVISSTPLAKGGLAYGETLATVGEYSGARSNPEVIAPLDRLRSILGEVSPNFGDVKFTIDGYQLVGILNKTNSKIATY